MPLHPKIVLSANICRTSLPNISLINAVLSKLLCSMTLSAYTPRRTLDLYPTAKICIELRLITKFSWKDSRCLLQCLLVNNLLGTILTALIFGQELGLCRVLLLDCRAVALRLVLLHRAVAPVRAAL